MSSADGVRPTRSHNRITEWMSVPPLTRNQNRSRRHNQTLKCNVIIAPKDHECWQCDVVQGIRGFAGFQPQELRARASNNMSSPLNKMDKLPTTLMLGQDAASVGRTTLTARHSGTNYQNNAIRKLASDYASTTPTCSYKCTTTQTRLSSSSVSESNSN
jgi:hypothetical protein